MPSQYFYQQCLREKLLERARHNPRYSIRSFAKAIGVGSSALSQIISGTRTVSTKVVDRMLAHLELDASEKRSFLESVIVEKKQKGLKRISPDLKARLDAARMADTQGRVHGVDLQVFRVISDWYHYAILELTFAADFKPESRWIADTLGITEIEAKVAVARLLELGLLEKVDGTLRKAQFDLSTTDPSKTSEFHRKRQKQVLEKSIYSLMHDPIETRNHSASTLCIDPKNLPAAKAKIRQCMKEIVSTLVPGDPSRVYELQVSLFPLQKGKK